MLSQAPEIGGVTDIPTSIKCVTLGDGCVGKTCLLVSYSQNKFPEEYVPTVFDNYHAYIRHEYYGKAYQVNFSLWDTSGNIYSDLRLIFVGQQDYDRLRPLSYPDTDVFLVCYSVLDPVSLQNVGRKWLKEIKEHCTLYADGIEFTPPVVLVGLKTDLRHDVKQVRELRDLTGKYPVTYDEAEKVQRELNIAKYVECSALTGHGVREVFHTAMDAVLERKIQKKKKKKCLIL